MVRGQAAGGSRLYVFLHSYPSSERATSANDAAGRLSISESICGAALGLPVSGEGKILVHGKRLGATCQVLRTAVQRGVEMLVRKRRTPRHLGTREGDWEKKGVVEAAD